MSKFNVVLYYCMVVLMVVVAICLLVMIYMVPYTIKQVMREPVEGKINTLTRFTSLYYNDVIIPTLTGLMCAMIIIWWIINIVMLIR